MGRFFAAQQSVHLGLTEPSVPPGSADAADASRGGPTGHRLRVNPEEGGHLSGGQQALSRALHDVSPPLSRSGAGGLFLSVPVQDRFLPHFRKTSLNVVERHGMIT